MKCPICKTEVNTYAFQIKSCPTCDFNGSNWNVLYNK